MYSSAQINQFLREGNKEWKEKEKENENEREGRTKNLVDTIQRNPHIQRSVDKLVYGGIDILQQKKEFVKAIREGTLIKHNIPIWANSFINCFNKIYDEHLAQLSMFETSFDDCNDLIEYRHCFCDYILDLLNA